MSAGASRSPRTCGWPPMTTPSAISPMSSPPTARWTNCASRSRVGSRPKHTDGIVRGTVELFPPSLYLRDTALTRRTPRSATLRKLSAPPVAATFWPSFTACWTACTKDMRPRRKRRATTPSDLRQRSMPRKPFRQATAPRGTSRSHRRRHIPSAFPPALSAATPAAPKPARHTTAATPGRKPWRPISAGSGSIRRTAFARRTVMTGVAVGLDAPSARRRSRTRLSAGGERSRSPSRSTR